MTGGQRQGTDRDLQQGGVDGQPEGQRLGVLSVELLERRHQGHAQLVGLEHCVSEQTGRSAVSGACSQQHGVHKRRRDTLNRLTAEGEGGGYRSHPLHWHTLQKNQSHLHHNVSEKWTC